MAGRARQGRALHITVARKQRDRKRLEQDGCKDPLPAICSLCLVLKVKDSVETHPGLGTGS